MLGLLAGPKGEAAATALRAVIEVDAGCVWRGLDDLAKGTGKAAKRARELLEYANDLEEGPIVL